MDEKLECFLAMNSREIIEYHFCFFRSSGDGRPVRCLVILSSSDFLARADSYARIDAM